MWIMTSSFCHLCGISDPARCCEQSFGSAGPCWRHGDARIPLSTALTSSQRCSARVRYEERRSCGRRREVSATSKKKLAATPACEMASYLAACVHLKYRGVTSEAASLRMTRAHPAGFPRSLFISALVSQAAAVAARGASFCRCSPSSRRFNDVYALKGPPARRRCWERSFLCGSLGEVLHS